jgi:monovalent cation/hydrogen antiporter
MPNIQLVLGLLAAASLLAAVARYVNVPYPVVLVIGGAALTALPGVPTVRIAPQVVFFVFLPPLLYSAAALSSPSELRHSAAPIVLLAVGLVLATVAAIAVVAHAAVGLTWAESFVLGAILSATDPLAATSIIRRLGAPQRIATLLEGEALVNDGTALTAFKVALAAVGAQSFSLGHGVLQFVEVAAGGAGIGLGVGALSALVRRRLDDADLEVTIAVLTAYAAYVAASGAGTSGVLAVVAAGLVDARVSASIFSPGTRLRSHAFWQVSSFILNALLFLLIGLQLRSALDGIRGTGPGRLAWQTAVVVAVVMLLRIAWMYVVPVAIGLVHRNPSGQPSRSPREQLVLGWSGMRGALSLAAALSLPLWSGRPDLATTRGTIVFLSFAAIFVTLVLPGLTLAALIRRLGLSQSELRQRQAAEARLRVIRAALSALEEMAENGRVSERNAARLRDLYETRSAAAEQRLDEQEGPGVADELREQQGVRQELLEAQRHALRRLTRERAAPVELLREIERDLDLEAARLHRL